ncbi:hemagglutinin repeat-containing protein [Comamonas testosteroni]|uniref:hemagglutinin repeat-containing protein n=1 Tax=Comamonas testosteroni TaxID=285 RepID=UPI002DBC28C2|nr:hemagglutinin repeat-containing protein [Comamonas testosteroni]MEB5963877.1 hemagglutinin repeat-containing protein [Comamonas testosteroni]
MTDLSAKTIQVLETRNRPASISVSLGSSKSQSNTAQTSDGARGSTVKAGGNVNIVAQGAGADSSILVRGSDITAGQDANLAAEGDIRLQAAQNTASLSLSLSGSLSGSSSSSSSSGSIGVSVGGQTGITVSASKGRGNQAGDDLTHTNTHIAAGNSVTLQSGGDTTLKGAVVSGKQVVAEVGGNLKLESLQDSSSYASRNQSAGGSLTISPVGVPIGGGLNAGRSKVNSHCQWREGCLRKWESLQLLLLQRLLKILLNQLRYCQSISEKLRIKYPTHLGILSPLDWIRIL